MPTDLVPHDLTSYTSHPPFVPSASSEAAGGAWAAWFAFDGGPNQWISGSGVFLDSWLQMDLGVAAVAGSYALASPGGAVAPKTWHLYGSNDGVNWSLLDIRNNEAAWATPETRTYTCLVAASAYRYFRLAFYANNGDGQYIQITEVNLFQGTASGSALVELGPHNLTSDTSQSPFVVSASSNNGSWPEWHAFEGSAGAGWATANGTTTGWLQIDLGSAKTLGSYAIQGTSDTPQAPNTFTMEGSNDGATWTTVDTRAGQTWGAYETKLFTCTSPGSYRYYRLNTTLNNGGQYVQVAELSLFEGVAPTGTPQTITFAAIADHVATDAPFVLAPTSTSGPRSLLP